MIDIRNAISYQDMLLGGRITSDQYQQISESPFQTIIDLRPDSEDGVIDDHVTAKKLGINSLNIPIAGGSGLTKEAVCRLDEALKREPGPFVLHCASGNRVGAILALRAYWCNGVKAEEALAIGKTTGLTSLEPVVRTLLGLPAEATT